MSHEVAGAPLQALKPNPVKYQSNMDANARRAVTTAFVAHRSRSPAFSASMAAMISTIAQSSNSLGDFAPGHGTSQPLTGADLATVWMALRT